jgi:hypothetical protein
MRLKSNPDVVYCAHVIARDLKPHSWPASPTWDDLIYLTERYGNALLLDDAIDRKRKGKCHDGEIILSDGLSLAEYREVVPHELVHRLADTPRWSWLNHRINGAKYDRHEFLEAVARLVGMMVGNRE